MEKINCIIQPQEAEKRLDGVLPHLLDISRNAAQKLISEGAVQINNKVETSKKRTLFCGDILSVNVPLPCEETLLPQAEKMQLNIVFEDSALLVINKPKGMVVHPGAGNPCHTLVNGLLFHCGKDNLSTIGSVYRPGIVHRLDKDTSGLMLIAKTNTCHESLSNQLFNRQIERIYHAVVHGKLKNDFGTINNYMGRHPKERKKMAVLAQNSAGAKHAVTHYEKIADLDGYTYLKVKLETGRTHQIRVHTAALGHPVAGDKLYGPKKSAKGLDSQCLHAKKLCFKHPVTETMMQFDSELPDEFKKFLKGLEFDYET